MYISSQHAKELEDLVCETLDCDYLAIGGYVSKDKFEHNPWYAALMCVAREYKPSREKLVNQFIIKWSDVFKYPEEDFGLTADEYIHDLKELVKNLMVEKR